MEPYCKALQLTPLDSIMPRTYLQVLFAFPTHTSGVSTSMIENLQQALDATSKQVPWLCGRVVPVTSASPARHALEIRYEANGRSPHLRDMGSVPVSYKVLAAEGMPPAAIPSTVWPVNGMIDDNLHDAGAPAFAVGFFRFADDQGAGLTVCAHHNATDASGFAEIIRLWVSNMNPADCPCLYLEEERSSLLTQALSTVSEDVQCKSLEALLEVHPEYSKVPPRIPSEFAPCTSKLFTIPVARIEVIKQLVRSCTSTPPTTNTIICAFIWTAITRVRMRRRPVLSLNDTTRLAMAVNGRKRMGQRFSTSENPYLGNIVLYSLAQLPMSMSRPADSLQQQESVHNLAVVCDAISESISPTKINSRHIAEVYNILSKVQGHQALFIGWDPFSGQDLTITSWADLALYELDFGPGLGRPDYVRIPPAAADGVCIVLPRKQGKTTDFERNVIELMVMLRKDDMNALEQDANWTDFAAP